MSRDISRRGFLKGAGVFGAAAAVAGLASSSPEESAATEETGGASRHACFSQINYGDSKAQNEMGYYYPTEDATGNPIDGFDAKAAAADWENHLQFSVETKMLLRSIEEGGKWASR